MCLSKSQNIFNSQNCLTSGWLKKLLECVNSSNNNLLPSVVVFVIVVIVVVAESWSLTVTPDASAAPHRLPGRLPSLSKIVCQSWVGVASPEVGPRGWRGRAVWALATQSNSQRSAGQCFAFSSIYSYRYRYIYTYRYSYNFGYSYSVCWLGLPIMRACKM